MRSITKKITIGGMFIAIGVLLPQLFHVFGQQAGRMFLPMHICVFIGGMVLGPIFGGCIGAVTPLISFLLFPMSINPLFMMIELALYGLIAGVCTKVFKLNVFISLLISQLGGRIVYAFLLFVFGKLVGLNVPAYFSVVTSFITGIPGIIIQLVLVPTVVVLLNKRGVFDDRFRKS